MLFIPLFNKRTPGTYNRLSPHPPPHSDSTLLHASSSSFLRTCLFPLLISTWEHLGVSGGFSVRIYHYYKEVELALLRLTYSMALFL